MLVKTVKTFSHLQTLTLDTSHGPRVDNRRSIILTDNDSLWLTYSDQRDEEVMTVSWQ